MLIYQSYFKKYLVLLLLVFMSLSYAQEQQLANNFFRKGEYEKAITIYQKLYEENNFNASYFTRLIYCQQQLEQFEEAKTLIEKHLAKYPSQIQFKVELGYNYDLQHENELAKTYYAETIEAVKKNPIHGYTVGRMFQKNHLLEYALQCYTLAIEANPNANYNIQIATIYGEKGEIENMFNSYLDLVDKDERYASTITRYIGKYITDDPENHYNILFRKSVLKRTQINPKNAWNELLSWFFLKQKEYNKAFVQEKALYRRTDSIGFYGIQNVGHLAFENKDYNTSKSVFEFVLDNANDQSSLLEAKLNLLFVDVEISDDYDAIDSQFQSLLNEYGRSSSTLNIQVAYADFLTFKKNNPKKAQTLLKEALKFNSTPYKKGEIKIKLGDVLVYSGKFNEALIYYSQVQTSLKNHILAQEAQFKVAKTSFYKGDFKWAQTQLKVLKGSTSQLIANDALDLSLIIDDNTVQDSLKTALKLYAKADLLAYQNKNKQAIDTLSVILKNHKGHAIEDETLFKQAEIFEKINDFSKAESNYLKLIEINTEDILVDDAYFRLAEINYKQNNIEKAKEYYQKIIFDFPSSIHLVEARKKYRTLRGDEIQ